MPLPEELAEDPQLQLSFEGLATAYAAVQEVYGTDHPLLQRSDEESEEDARAGVSLWDELYRQDDTEPRTFSGEIATIIQQALEEIARPDSPSLHQATARMMLDTPPGHGEALVGWADPDARTAPAAADEPETPAAPQPARRAPHSVDGAIVEGHVRLSTFGHLATALNSVKAFADKEDQRQAVPVLEAAIQDADPFHMKPIVIWQPEAGIVHDALVKAATNRRTVHDISAGEMLAESPDDSPEATPSQAGEFAELV